MTAIKTWARALRCTQWVKNILVFVPLFASHQWGRVDLDIKACIAFVVFSLCASSIYLINDIFDIENDRRHPLKCRRPLAAAEISVTAGIVVALALFVFALAGGLLWLPEDFAAVLAVYWLLSIAYSAFLKRVVIVDVLVLASFYTLRIVAGVIAVGTMMTFWLLAFSIFIFTSLAFVKRYVELKSDADSHKREKSLGRGYQPEDLPFVGLMGVTSGYISVLVLALYIQDRATAALYQHPEWIWLAGILLLFWISRIWLLANRGKMHDDPVVFALKDKAGLAVGILFLGVFWLAT